MISSKLFGLADPRTYGSGNPGATNVLRSGNKKAALVTLIGDALKGWARRLRRPADGLQRHASSASSPWPSSSATSTRFSSSSRAARASPPRPACCSRSIRCSAWRSPAPGCWLPSPPATPRWPPSPPPGHGAGHFRLLMHGGNAQTIGRRHPRHGQLIGKHWQNIQRPAGRQPFQESKIGSKKLNRRRLPGGRQPEHNDCRPAWTRAFAGRLVA
jgi:glycerol-3-phosphate acyltransferase PlsY